MRAVPRAGQSAEQRAEAGCGHRGQGRGGREARGTGEGKAEEDYVAGHVRHEDMPEGQVAERVDQAGHQRQADQQRRQRAMPAFPVRYEGVTDFGEKVCH